MKQLLNLKELVFIDEGEKSSVKIVISFCLIGVILYFWILFIIVTLCMGQADRDYDGTW
jgi:hypothetical protein